MEPWHASGRVLSARLTSSRARNISLGLGRTRAIGLSQHPDQHGPERPILLAVDQELREDAHLRWPKREMDEFDPMETGTPALRFLSARGEFRPLEPDSSDRVVFDLRLPGPVDPHTD